MAIQTLTVQLPDRLYAQLRHRAQQANRSVEAELVDLVATAMPGVQGLPDEFDMELAGLEHLDDEALWQAARSRLAASMARRNRKLHHKRQGREGLTEAEAQSSRRTVAAIRTGDADPRPGRSLVKTSRP